MILYPHIDTNAEGHLTIDGADAVELAREFGTPAYILCEDVIRENCRTYLRAARAAFGENALPLYASKALCFTGIYRLVAEEGLGVDCVSGGELYTAANAGFPAERIYFHGNNKTDADLQMALDMGVGSIVADNCEELEALDTLAAKAGKVQRVLLRITPGIDPHTHRAISTGHVDSKFGSAIVTGQALAITELALSKKHLSLAGFHCHVGSQIFDVDPFRDAAHIMLQFIADVKAKTGFEATELNLGGGLGVPYTESDRRIDYAAVIAEIGEIVKARSAALGIKAPRIILEPGRSLVAAAGVTLYTVGSVKEIPGFRNYVSVDGGMPDNPRYALYQSQYTALVANRATAPRDYVATVAGRCCESGDLIGEGMALQRPVRGDILAVLTTGAYNYAMASNYNKLPRPPVVMLSGGKPRLAVRRESFADLVKNDL